MALMYKITYHVLENAHSVLAIVPGSPSHGLPNFGTVRKHQPSLRMSDCVNCWMIIWIKLGAKSSQHLH